MKNFLIKVGINAVALWVAAYAVSGFHLADSATDWQQQALTIVLVALLFGVVNAVLGSLARFLSFPAIVLTLGLFTFIVNAFLLQVTEWLAGPLGLDFSIDEFFWDAVFAALIVSLVSWLLDAVLPGDRDRD